jgi:predicted LPLAT superfamily acyltransferase
MPTHWASQDEGGSLRALRVALRLVLLLGPRLGAMLLLPPVTAWYLARDAEARAASRDFLRRARGTPPGFAAVARHLHSFAGATLDRVFFLARRTRAYDIRVEGLDHVERILARGQGCIMLGAHLGSFEVLRSLGRQAPVAVHPVMYRRNAGALTAVLDTLAPDLAACVIDIGETNSMLLAKEALERGEIVGLLADRCPRGERTVPAPFLGSPASFPVGPFILAAALGSPVVLFFGLRTGPRRYTIRFEAFQDRLVLRRATREADLAAAIATYAGRVEEMCRTFPYNWFNFFPFWETEGHA